MTQKFEIDQEIVDDITLSNLKKIRTELKQELDIWEEKDIIPDFKLSDVGYNIRLIKCLNEVIKYFGE